jgi:mRNA interferase RelE/StbE
MPHAIYFAPSADKALRTLPEAIQKRIVAAVEELGNNPRPPGCKKLKGEDDLWRIRIGDYRAVYTLRDAELLVLVVRVAHRKDVYKE